VVSLRQRKQLLLPQCMRSLLQILYTVIWVLWPLQGMIKTLLYCANHKLSSVHGSAGLGPITFLIVVNIILLIGGQFMEPSGLLIIVAPLVFPIAMELGIDPIHLGIIMVVNMEIGMITPPVGLNLFVTAGVAQMSITNVVKAALPWVGIKTCHNVLLHNWCADLWCAKNNQGAIS